MRIGNLLCGIALSTLGSLAAAQSVDHSQHRHETPPVVESETTSPSEAEHVPPEPPQHVMGDMSYASMVSTMQMDDTVPVGRLLFDQLEWRDTQEGDVGAWDAKASYGGDYNKALLKTEGEYLHDTIKDAHAELLWDRIFARWWSVQVGARQDFGEGPDRSWVAIGIEGLAPNWFDVEATVYVGDAGRTALRFDVEYDLLLTQRLILRAGIEGNVYGKADPERQLGSGLSDGQVSLRLRYEIRREFAPYVGINWQKKFAGSADYAEAAGWDASDVQAIAGFRFWF